MTATNKFTTGKLLISREYEGIKFQDSSFSDEQKKVILTEVLIGNPSRNYIQLYEKNQELYYINYKGTSETAIINIISTTKDKIEDTLVKESSAKAIFSEMQMEDSYLATDLENAIKELSQYSDISTLLFALYTNIPIIILGSNVNDTFTMINYLLDLLPPHIAREKTFSTHNSELKSIFSFQGIPATQESLDIINTAEFDKTLISLTKKKIIGNYDCSITIELATTIRENNQEQLKREILEIYYTAVENREANIEEIMEKHGINRGDAEFLQKVATHVTDTDKINQWR